MNTRLPTITMQLRERYPDLMSECLYNDGVRAGWSSLLLDLAEQLSSEVRISQIKEKFGFLRIYVDKATTEDYAHIASAENLSLETCEVCGDHGALRVGNWLSTLCDGHAQGRKKWTAEPTPTPTP